MHSRLNKILGFIVFFIAFLFLGSNAFANDEKEIWNIELYNNMYLEGIPKVITGENISKTSDINFNFGDKAPDETIGKDHFSMRFTKNFQVAQGTYLFRVKADDGIRVWIDNKLIIDAWEIWKPENIGKVFLDAGNHSIKIEYFENIGDASFSVTQEKISTLNAYYQQEGEINYNWGYGSPHNSVPVDNFEAVIDQKKYFKAGDYFIQTLADNRAKVLIDNQQWIDLVSTGSNTIEKQSLLGVGAGYHSIKSILTEETGEAVFFSNVLPFGSWIAYYYPNENLSGQPVQSKVIEPKGSLQKLEENNGNSSPLSNFQNDHFSVRYSTAMRISAGEYVMKTIADDGLRVYIDGNLVLDRWEKGGQYEEAFKVGINDRKTQDPNEKNVHWIEIQYKEGIGESNLAFNIEPYKDEMFSDRWVGSVYQGETPTVNNVLMGYTGMIPYLEAYWDKNTAPSTSILSDKYSGMFKRNIKVDRDGFYKIKVWADDRVRVYLDTLIQIDSWEYKQNILRESYVYMKAGYHQFVINYQNDGGPGSLKFGIEEVTGERGIIYTNYNISQNEMLNKQLKLDDSPKTDKPYDVYISSDAITINKTNPSIGTVKSGNWNLREDAGTNFWVIGQVSENTTLNILSSKKGTDNKIWYKVKYDAWKNAKPKDVSYFINPANFDINSSNYLQFLLLSVNTNIDVAEVNSNILKNKGILSGKANAFISAGITYKVNEIYLISHALLETGNGTSRLANGILVNKINGKSVTPRVVYNMYGINANDTCPEKCGSEFAYQNGWFSPEAAIIGGAQFIAQNYIHAGQDTLYKMRWNPESPATHQYASDIGWAVKQTYRIDSLYSLLSKYTLLYDVPIYK